MRSYIVSFLLFLLAFVFVSHPAEAVDTEGWHPAKNLPTKLASHTSFGSSSRIYVVSGSGFTGSGNTDVIYSDILYDGALSDWVKISDLPQPLIWHSQAVHKSHVYILGGYLDPSPSVNTIYVVEIVEGGGLGGWGEMEGLPKALAQGGAVVVGDRLYFGGGFTKDGSTEVPSKEIYMSSLGPDGTVLGWSPAGELPDFLWGFGMLEVGGKIVVVGGRSPEGDQNKVWIGQLESDGKIGAWSEGPALPRPSYRGSVGRVENTVVSVGGEDLGTFLSDVYYSEIGSGGEIGGWITSGHSFPRVHCCSPLAVWQNKIYVTGGHDGNNYYGDVYWSRIGPDPTPGPTAVPSPTPSPSVVDKVVLVPGLGASWNRDALLNCKDSGYEGGWSMAGFAAEVYQPLMTALEKADKKVHVFYYDWRRPVSYNADKLKQFAEGVANGGQVDIVGHSMGGLVARRRVELGEADEISKLLTVGSPHEGAVAAYPAWSGGEIWNDNLLFKIAQTIGVKRCERGGGNDRQAVQAHFPSIQQLLPTFDYLKDKKTGEVKPVAEMAAQNNWLPSGFAQPFGGVEVGTIGGIGHKTLKEIKTKPRSRRDEREGKWEDGKPVGTETDPVGDGTVLLSSSRVPGASNWIVTGDHLEIVSSKSSLGLIFDFLGIVPEPEVVPYMSPKSALVVVGEGVGAEIGRPDGSVVLDRDGVGVVFNPPESGRFRLKLKPTRSPSSLSIGEFLESGEVVWDDLRFVGLGDRTREFYFGR